MSSTSKFSAVQLAPPIEVFQLGRSYLADTDENKVNLGIGAYRTEEGKPWVLPVVRLAEKRIAEDETLKKEYLPVLGMDKFTIHATKLLLGDDSEALIQGRAFGVQGLSGTGALRIGAEFLNRVMGHTAVYYSDPSWENHRLLFKNAGFTDIKQYRYWCEEKRGLNFGGMIEDLMAAPENSIIVLHACAHNPTGCDPTQDQWKCIADIMAARNHFVFFDSAYQGFASGDLDKDAWAVRYFVSRGFELFCAQSFAKNLGLYNERIGNLTIVTNHASRIPMVKSQMTLIIRGMYSNPPSHGAMIAEMIFNDSSLFAEWKKNILTMSKRIRDKRSQLKAALDKLGTPGNWDHITTQIGMFSYTGLTEQQSQYMIDKHHVYMLRCGRISMCGLTSSNVDYVARAIHDTINKISNKL